MLSEIRQTEKDKCCMISLICGILKAETETKNQTHRNREKIGGCCQGQIRAGMKILVIR